MERLILGCFSGSARCSSLSHARVRACLRGKRRPAARPTDDDWKNLAGHIRKSLRKFYKQLGAISRRVIKKGKDDEPRFRGR